MRAGVREHRGTIFAGLVVIVLAALAAELSTKNKEGEGAPSNYSGLRRGGKAAFLLLEQSGYTAQRWERPPQELPNQASDAVLIIAGPEGFPSEEERGGLSRFLLNGGRVLLAGTMPQWFVPRSSASAGEMRIGYAECKPVAPTRLTRGGPITQDQKLAWDSADDTALAHYADEEGKSVVVSYRVGKGEVIWWASPVPLINSGITTKGNLELFLNSIGERRRVLWDEYYHGHQAFALFRGSTAALKWAGLQAALLAGVLLITFSRRNGPIFPLIQDSHLSPFEFVETLGSVFHRAQSTQVAVEIASGRFRQLAVRRLGLRGNARPEDLVRAMRNRGFAVTPEIEATVQSSDDAATNVDLSEQAAIKLVRNLNQAAALVAPSISKRKE